MATVQVYSDNSYDNLMDQFQTQIADDMSEEFMERDEAWYDQLIALVCKKHNNSWRKIIWFSKYHQRTHFFDHADFFETEEDNSISSLIPRAYLFGSKFHESVKEQSSALFVEKHELQDTIGDKLDTIKSTDLHVQYINKVLREVYDELYSHATVIYPVTEANLLFVKLADNYKRIIFIQNIQEIQSLLKGDVKFY